MGLFGLILVGLLALLIPSLHSNVFHLVVSTIGVIVFAGLTAYDNQKIKKNYLLRKSRKDDRNIAIEGALTLYLDFINLFLRLLSLFGRRR